MRVGEPTYVTKFVMKVREEDLKETLSTLRDSVAPEFREAGFGEMLVAGRRMELEKLDREGPGVMDSPVLARLIENAPPDDPSYASDLRALHRGLTHGISGSAHSMLNHHKKRKHLEEYEMLRREIYSEENRLRVAGVQIDCYAFHNSEMDLKADTTDLDGRNISPPHSARSISKKLDHLLFVKLKGIHYTVVSNDLPERRNQESENLCASQLLTPVPLNHHRDFGEHVRVLADSLSSHPTFAGSLLLKSRGRGFDGSFGWLPTGLRQHRGDEPRFEDGFSRTSDPRSYLEDSAIPHELITLWLTRENEEDGAERPSGIASETLKAAILGENGGGRVMTTFSDLALRI